MIVLLVFSTDIIFSPIVQAQGLFHLPQPGMRLTISPKFTPPIMTGMSLDPDNPLQFDFIINTGDENVQGESLRMESAKLINYFLATLAVPEDEMWVNLSPYEKERIMAEGLGQTEMGRDMLAQDYLLKQLTASLMYPEDKVGNEFWQRVYKEAKERFGTIDILTNTFNKIWIVPDEAVVYVHDTSIFVMKSHLKVMLEEDYVALEMNVGSEKHGAVGAQLPDGKAGRDASGIDDISSQIVREVLLPEIEKEVNEGKNFAALRQIFHSMILATWYKKNLKASLLGKIYADQNKLNGIDLEDKQVKEKIYNQYVEAFQKGVYDYIKEEYDPSTKEIIPRKYFSGGIEGINQAMVSESKISIDWARSEQNFDHAMVSFRGDIISGDAKISSYAQDAGKKQEAESVSGSDRSAIVRSQRLKDFSMIAFQRSAIVASVLFPLGATTILAQTSDDKGSKEWKEDVMKKGILFQSIEFASASSEEAKILQSKLEQDVDLQNKLLDLGYNVFHGVDIDTPSRYQERSIDLVIELLNQGITINFLADFQIRAVSETWYPDDIVKFFTRMKSYIEMGHFKLDLRAKSQIYEMIETINAIYREFKEIRNLAYDGSLRAFEENGRYHTVFTKGFDANYQNKPYARILSIIGARSLLARFPNDFIKVYYPFNHLNYSEVLEAYSRASLDFDAFPQFRFPKEYILEIANLPSSSDHYVIDFRTQDFLNFIDAYIQEPYAEGVVLKAIQRDFSRAVVVISGKKQIIDSLRNSKRPLFIRLADIFEMDASDTRKEQLIQNLLAYDISQNKGQGVGISYARPDSLPGITKVKVYTERGKRIRSLSLANLQSLSSDQAYEFNWDFKDDKGRSVNGVKFYVELDFGHSVKIRKEIFIFDGSGGQGAPDYAMLNAESRDKAMVNEAMIVLKDTKDDKTNNPFVIRRRQNILEHLRGSTPDMDEVQSRSNFARLLIIELDKRRPKGMPSIFEDGLYHEYMYREYKKFIIKVIETDEKGFLNDFLQASFSLSLGHFSHGNAAVGFILLRLVYIGLMSDRMDYAQLNLEVEVIDQAMFTKGGIDFNSDNLNLQEQGQKINFNFSSSGFDNIQPSTVDGILPVIINITPVVNFSLLLGMSEMDREPQLSRL